MEAAELLLEAVERGVELPVGSGGHGSGEVGDLPQLPDPDPQPVKSLHRRTAAGFRAGLRDPLASARVVGDQQPAEVRGACGPGRTAEGPGDLVEEAGLRLGAGEGPQELASRARIVPEPGPVPLEHLGLEAGTCFRPDRPEELEQDVPIADASDETGEATDPAVEREELRAVPLREQLPPDREGYAKPSQLPVEMVEASGGRVGATDHLGDVPAHRLERALDLPKEAVSLRLRGGVSGGSHGTRTAQRPPDRKPFGCGRPGPSEGS